MRNQYIVEGLAVYSRDNVSALSWPAALLFIAGNCSSAHWIYNNTPDLHNEG